MQRFSFSSLRVHFFLLVLFAVLPALGVILYSAWEQRQTALDQEAKNVASLAATAAKEYDDIFSAARELLIGLKGIDEIFSATNSSATPFLAI